MYICNHFALTFIIHLFICLVLNCFYWSERSMKRFKTSRKTTLTYKASPHNLTYDPTNCKLCSKVFLFYYFVTWYYRLEICVQNFLASLITINSYTILDIIVITFFIRLVCMYTAYILLIFQIYLCIYIYCCIIIYVCLS